MGQRYPLPITPAMLAPANPVAAYPRYDSNTDWRGGIVGNDVDVATANVAVADASKAGGGAPLYTPRTQTEKGTMMVPPLTPLADLGMDYGVYTGNTGRTGTLEPLEPYGTPP